MRQIARISASACLLVASLAVVFSGCGGERTYKVTGTVSFNGKPVPTGHIVFEPDAAAGNNGAPAYASITDGHYDTSADGGSGTIGGPHLVRIHGRDGIPRGELLKGLPLFKDYETKVDLPKEDGKQDFEVPSGRPQQLLGARKESS